MYKPNTTDVKVCRLCLNINCRLFDINENNLVHTLDEFTSLKSQNMPGLPPYICSFCCCLLKKASVFRNQCIETQNYLYSVSLREPLITEVLKEKHTFYNKLVLTARYISNFTIVDKESMESMEEVEIKTEIDDENIDDDCDLYDNEQNESISYLSDDNEHLIDNNQLPKIECLSNNEHLPDNKHSLGNEHLSDNECLPHNEHLTVNEHLQSKRVNKSKPNIERKRKTAKSNTEIEAVTVFKPIKVYKRVRKIPKVPVINTNVDINTEIVKENITEKEIETQPNTIEEDNITTITISDSETKSVNKENEKTPPQIATKEVGDDIKSGATHHVIIAKRNIEDTPLKLNKARIKPIKIPEEILNKPKRKRIRPRKEVQITGIIQKLQSRQEKLAKECNFEVICLTEKEQRDEILSRKDHPKYNTCRNKCEICYLGFVKETTYNHHMKTHDPTRGRESCEICHVRLLHDYHKVTHMSTHKYKFACKSCDVTYRDGYNVKQHFLGHKGEKFPCKYCDKIFRCKKTRIHHMRTRHSEHRCDVCYKSMALSAVNTHKAWMHEQVFSCDTCKVTFDSKLALVYHLGSVAGSCKDVSPCCVCGKNFEGRDQLERHITGAWCIQWLKSGHRPKKKTYKKKKVVKQTKQDKLVCEICAKDNFKSLCFLRLHQRIHTGERPFECDHCQKRFRTKEAITLHMATHSSDRPYKCRYCEKRFKQPAPKCRHEKDVHTRAPRFECAICWKRFHRKLCLKLHIDTVHMKMPHPPRNRKRRRQEL